METERIALSQEERDRLQVFRELEQGGLKQVAAAQRMTITDRQVRRLLQRWRKEGSFEWRRLPRRTKVTSYEPHVGRSGPIQHSANISHNRVRTQLIATVRHSHKSLSREKPRV
jgi:hypothetical protein